MQNCDLFLHIQASQKYGQPEYKSRKHYSGANWEQKYEKPGENKYRKQHYSGANGGQK